MHVIRFVFFFLHRAGLLELEELYFVYLWHTNALFCSYMRISQFTRRRPKPWAFDNSTLKFSFILSHRRQSFIVHCDYHYLLCLIIARYRHRYRWRWRWQRKMATTTRFCSLTRWRLHVKNEWWNAIVCEAVVMLTHCYRTGARTISALQSQIEVAFDTFSTKSELFFFFWFYHFDGCSTWRDLHIIDTHAHIRPPNIYRWQSQTTSSPNACRTEYDEFRFGFPFRA